MKPKGYWIARLDVTDADTYKTYVKANAEAFAKYGAKFLTRGGPFTALEGQNRSRNVVLEFDSVETALACYHSPEYQRAFDIRRNAALADIVIMAGYDGPQPPEQPGEQANVHVDGGTFREIVDQHNLRPRRSSSDIGRFPA